MRLEQERGHLIPTVSASWADGPAEVARRRLHAEGAIPMPPRGYEAGEVLARPVIGPVPTATGLSGLPRDAQVVSVLLPTSDGSCAAEGNRTAAGQVYIVVLEPLNSYATYACALPPTA